MPIAISEEHRALAQTVAGLLARHQSRAAARSLLEAEADALPAFWAELGGLGLLGLHLPEEHGGSGFGLPETLVVAEQMGRHLAPGPFAPTVITSAVLAAAGVPVGFGTDVLTVSATASGHRTGYAQTTVTSDVISGTTVLDVPDAAGDGVGNDTGPGTYQYPTSPDFQPGAFKLTRFQVINDGTTVYLQATIANLAPTFGNAFGAQLLDVYVHAPGAVTTSTAAAYTTRNYTIAPANAWSELVEAQGFAAPVWHAASGNSLGTPFMSTSQTSGTVTIALPQATFGTPGPGWSFAVVLTGHDGFSSDQARAFTATPGPFSFGVCAVGGTSPICSVDPATVPKAMDVITPAGVSQDTELDPTLGPVVIQGVTVP